MPSKGKAEGRTGTRYEDTLGYVHCRLFSCVTNSSRDDCCYYCKRREGCSNPCLNHPDKCGAVIKPAEREKGT